MSDIKTPQETLLQRTKSILYKVALQKVNQQPLIKDESQKQQRINELIEEQVEKLQQQSTEDVKIQSIIQSVVNNPTQRVPYGPILMRTKSGESITAHESALRTQIQEGAMKYCRNRAKDNQTALNACVNFHKSAVLYGMKFFDFSFKYQYTLTHEKDDDE